MDVDGWRESSVARTARALTKTTEIDMANRLDRDQELLTALRGHEPLAAEALNTAYGDRAYRLAVRITRNNQDAEEAVQDAFWSVIRKIDTFRGDSAFGSWVYRIVSNAAYAKVRRRRQALVDISLDEVLPPFDQNGRHASVITDWSRSIDDPAVQSDLRAVLTSAISELPDHYRTALILRDVEGLSNAEVAEALLITIPTAKMRAHRARLFLRKRLSIFMAGSSDLATVGRLSRTREAGQARTSAGHQLSGRSSLAGANQLKRDGGGKSIQAAKYKNRVHQPPRQHSNESDMALDGRDIALIAVACDEIFFCRVATVIRPAASYQ
jgi:RNA polymerase sigma-70 factor (ECF subfamily)